MSQQRSRVLPHARMFVIAAASAVLAPLFCTTVEAVPLLPDLIAWENAQRGYMHIGTWDTTTEPGRALWRFTAAIPNIGDGPFEVFEITHPDQTQDVYQNIYDSGGGFTQTLIGTFPDAQPAFGHLFLVGLAQYNLREVLPGNGVGPIVSSRDKTSFGLVDSVPYDTGLPGAPAGRVYNSSDANPLGVSIGWADLYTWQLPGQWVDATGLPSGQYWLEVVIDPYNLVQELDDTNNTERVLINLTVPDVSIDGDVDGDGFVGLNDLDIVLNNWNQNVPPADPLADIAGPGGAGPDGFVGLDDLDLVLGNWNVGTPPTSHAVIPEPGVGAALSGLLILTCRLGRR